MIYHKTKVTVHQFPDHNEFDFYEFSNEVQKLRHYRQEMHARTPEDLANGQAATVPLGQGSAKFNEQLSKHITGSITFVWQTEELANEYMEQITNNKILSKYFTVVYDGTINETDLYIDTEDV